MTKSLPPDKLFGLQRFNSSYCFLCGAQLKDNRTQEHVFPKWLQNTFNLWSQQLRLQNGTGIPYRQLTISCCQECNGVYLASLEREMSTAVKGGYTAIMRLKEDIIFQWISKIFYGILFKELFLATDRQRPTLGTIATSELLKTLDILHGHLQSIRYPMLFEAGQPWSIFVFKCHDYELPERNFHYHDVFQTLTFSIRMGEVGIIAALNDNNLLHDWFVSSFSRFEDIPLHPIQFDELSALVTYQAFLINRGITSIAIGADETEEDAFQIPTHIVSPSPRGYCDEGVFLPHNRALKIDILYRYWREHGIERDDIFRPPGMMLTFLENEDDSIKRLSRWCEPLD